MTAAEMTATVSSGPIGAGSAESSAGTVNGTYTVTITTTLDWVILSKFTAVHYVHAMTVADGVDAEAYVDSTTTNKVFVTGTGATILYVVGTPA